MENLFEFIFSRAELISVIVGLISVFLTGIPLTKKILEQRKKVQEKTEDRYTVTIKDNKLAGKNTINISMRESDISEISIAGRDISVENSMRTMFKPPIQEIGPDANLQGAFLNRVDLEEEDLRRANLSKAILIDANLAFANLSSANLEDANLEGCYLQKANMKKANLKGANLENANLDGVRLEGAIYNSTTKWPNEFNPENYGAILETV